MPRRSWPPQVSVRRLRDRLPNIASWKFALAAVATTLMVCGIVALALGLGADEEPLSDGAATLRDRDRPGPAEGHVKQPRQPAELLRLAREMSVERKVAQLFLLGFQGQDLTAPVYRRLRRLDLGGIVIDAPNYGSSDQLAALAGEAGVIAKQAGHVAPWVMAPQEGGEFNAFPDLPPATAAADLASAADAFDEASLAATTLAGLGLNGVLTPVVDVGPPDGVAVGARAFSNDPRDVADYAKAVVDAYRDAGVLSAASHFPGLGSGTEDTRLGPSQVGAGLDELRARDLIPFRAAIRSGVPAIVISNGLYVTDDYVTPGTLSRAVTTNLLRGDLGFRGIAITDDLADPPVTALTTVPQAAVRAVEAGANLLYVSGPAQVQQEAYEAVLKAVRSKRIGRAELDAALLRNLSVKRNYGLID